MEKGTWVDNEHFIVYDGHGAIVLAGIDGTKIKYTLEGKSVNVSEVSKYGDVIYYIDSSIDDKTKQLKYDFRSFNTKDDSIVTLQKNIWRFEASSDKAKFALIQNIGDRERALLITDREGKQQGELRMKNTQFYDLKWSPDSSKLAFSTFNHEDEGKTGLFIMDAASGQINQLVSKAEIFEMEWSPSGKQLLFNQSYIITGGNEVISNIATF
jgi:hypothetical protein